MFIAYGTTKLHTFERQLLEMRLVDYFLDGAHGVWVYKWATSDF